MGINLNPQNLMKALQIASPAMGPMAGPLAALVKGIAGSQKGIDNMKGALAQLLKGSFQKASGGAAQGQPASRPQPFSPTVINIQIVMNPVANMQQGPSSAGPLQSFAKAPEVGNDSQWGGLANAVNSRITGNDKSFNMNATNPWQGGGDKTDMAAVAWAMQKNDKVKFNSDTKQFFVTNADGSTKNVASLDEVKGQIAKAGGASPSNGAAYNAVGSFINNRVNNSQAPAAGQQSQAANNSNPFEQLVNMLKKLLETLMGGAKGSEGVGAPAQAQAASGSGSGSGVSGAPASPAGSASTSSAPAGQGQGTLDAAKGGMDSMIDRVGSKLESMQSEAERLMASDKPADQLKGQRLMQQMNRMFEMMSKMIEDIGKKATSALKRSDYQPA